MEKVAITRRVDDEGYVELLQCHVEEYGGPDGAAALLVFADIVVATDYLDLSEGLDDQEGWKVVEVGTVGLVAICAAFGIGYVALPHSSIDAQKGYTQAFINPRFGTGRYHCKPLSG